MMNPPMREQWYVQVTSLSGQTVYVSQGPFSSQASAQNAADMTVGGVATVKKAVDRPYSRFHGR